MATKSVDFQCTNCTSWSLGGRHFSFVCSLILLFLSNIFTRWTHYSLFIHSLFTLKFTLSDRLKNSLSQQQAATHFQWLLEHLKHFYLPRCSLCRNLGRLSEDPAEKSSFFLIGQINSHRQRLLHNDNNDNAVVIIQSLHRWILLSSPLSFQTDYHYCLIDPHVETVGPETQNELVQCDHQATGLN